MASNSTISVTFKLAGDAKSFKELIGQSDALKKALDSAAVSSDKMPRRVMSMQKAFRGLAGQLGGIAAGFLGIRSAIRGIRSAVDLIADFEKANSELAAVLGTTADGVKELSDAAQVLGRSTKFTASEVTSLQVSLARLGFTNQQILAMEEPTLKFAAAVGTDLGSAADFAGSALRAFGLRAEDTQGLLDMMAASTTKSALDFSKLQASISTVGPVAKAFGLSASETVAFLGALSNAGFDASTAATALRNILLNLADSNGNLAKGLGYTARTMPEIIAALKDLRSRGVDLNETLKMTDKRSVAAFNTFLSGVDTLDQLNNELKDVNGSLDQMYGTMTNNVTGSVDRLKSAWQGFILQMSESKGVIKGAIDLLTKFVDMANRAFFKNARVDAAADFFSKGLEEAMQNGGVEAAEAWYNSMMDTIDKKFRQSIDADPRKYRANMEGLKKAWAEFGAKYFVNGPETPAVITPPTTPPIIPPTDPDKTNNSKTAVKDLATEVVNLRKAMADAETTGTIFSNRLEMQDQVLSTMRSGITQLIKEYGAESDEVKQLIAEYNTLKEARKKSGEMLSLTKGKIIQPAWMTNQKEAGLDMSGRITQQRQYTLTVEDTTSALGAMSSAFSSLSGAVGDSAAAWLDWISNLLTAVGQAIPAIMSLTTANRAEATSNVAAGASAAGKSVASIPYVGPVLAVAAIASFIAAMANIPKFANGGLAYGTTLGVFGEYPGASHNPEVVAPLDKLRGLLRDTGSAGRVDFHIKGRDLYGVLSTESNLKSRS